MFCFRSHAKCVSQALEQCLSSKTWLDSRMENMGRKLRLCIDYNMLKEVYEPNECVSSVERFLFIMKLIRLVDDTPTLTSTPNGGGAINGKHVSYSPQQHATQPVHVVSASSSALLQSELAECRKKLKLLLLEDLYALNKAEKCWLQMSFIRKQQADLLEWIPLNGYEIFYVINSLN